MLTAETFPALRDQLDAIASGAPANGLTAPQLRALAGCATAAANRINADAAAAHPRAAPAPPAATPPRAQPKPETVGTPESKSTPAPPAPAASAAPKKSPYTPLRRPDTSDSSSDSDAGPPAELDEDFVAEKKAAGNAAFKAKDYPQAVKAWSAAAKHIKAAHKGDAKLSSNIAAALLASDKFVAAAHHAAESVDADSTWWKGHWYRGQALHKMVRRKPASLAMSERLEQSLLSLNACLKAPTLPAAKRDEVEKEVAAAKRYQLQMTETCKQS